MPNRNLELKARCRDLRRAAQAASSLGATRAGELHQLDTYFHFAHGRLKLRETASPHGRGGTGGAAAGAAAGAAVGAGGAELIAYERANDPAFRGSDYYVIPISHPAEMKAALAQKLGVRGEVRKRRELFLWHNVRIHLDDVAGLGTFIEFEAVLSPPLAAAMAAGAAAGAADDEALSLERLAQLKEALAIRDEDRIAVSYSDLAGF